MAAVMPTIEFLCHKRVEEILPSPEPAASILPDWYINLDYTVANDHENIQGQPPETDDQHRTVKMCIPFMEAMTRGWILKTPCDIYWETQNDGVHLEGSPEINAIGMHQPDQLGKEFPVDPTIKKFNNHWYIKTPPGYSCLFIQPLNRIENRFTMFSGIVDTDTYANFIHFPLLWTADEDEGVIDKGTPYMQIIPFQRGSGITDAEVRALTDNENKMINTTQEMINNADQGWYRDEIWKSKESTRTVSTSEDK